MTLKFANVYFVSEKHRSSFTVHSCFTNNSMLYSNTSSPLPIAHFHRRPQQFESALQQFRNITDNNWIDCGIATKKVEELRLRTFIIADLHIWTSAILHLSVCNFVPNIFKTKKITLLWSWFWIVTYSELFKKVIFTFYWIIRQF